MRAVCAVSGGMDSAACLWDAVKRAGAEYVIGVSAYYGQRHDIELTKAKEECEKLGVKHIELDLSPIFAFNKDISALLKGSKEEVVQDKTYAQLMDEKIAKGEKPISDEYIPNRNSIIANILAAVGMQFFKGCEFEVIMGVHSDDNLKREGSDISAYPDCSPEWSRAVNKELEIGTAGLVHLTTPLVYKTKTGVACFGRDAGMTKEDFNNTWSCYKGGTKQCGKCPTCIAEGGRVYMADGTLKPIEQIKVGDKVWAMGDNYQVQVTRVTELLYKGVQPCYNVNGLECTADHLLFSPRRNHRKAGYLPLSYLVPGDTLLTFPTKYAAINNTSFIRGYLRGFVEGDGHIGNRGVFTCQKQEDILVEFWSLYNRVISPTSTTVKWDVKREMWIGDGGYAPLFTELTSFDLSNEDYIKGYLNGMIIADGCASYNKSNNSFGYTLTQSLEANKEKCARIDDCFRILGITPITWTSRAGGYKENGSLMKNWRVCKPWLIPLVYGASKKDDMLFKCSIYGSFRMMPKEVIEEVNEIGLRKVYDINTEAHSFFAEGVLVHNCKDRIKALVNAGVYNTVEDITDNYELSTEEASYLLKD